MCALLSLRPDFPWSHHGGRACPPPYHNSSLLRNSGGGLEGCGGRRGGGQTGTGASLWHSSPLFPRCPLHADPLLLCQPSGTLTLPGPLGHSRTKTYLSFPDLVPRKPPCGMHSSHSWENDTKSLLNVGFLPWHIHLRDCCVGVLCMLKADGVFFFFFLLATGFGNSNSFQFPTLKNNELLKHWKLNVCVCCCFLPADIVA